MGIGRPAVDMAGVRKGRLVVVRRAENTRADKAQWLCKCDCGNEVVVSRRNLIGTTFSCGCLARELSSLRRKQTARPTLERLQEKIAVNPETECWEFTGKPDKYGYGKIDNQFAHRLMYETHVGPIGELCVLHRCDNPLCCNPVHLFLGTRKDNNDDKIAKKRHRFGSGVVGSKLTEDKVREIRLAYADGVRQRRIARDFGIAQSTVSQICGRQRWGHLT